MKKLIVSLALAAGIISCSKQIELPPTWQHPTIATDSVSLPPTPEENEAVPARPDTVHVVITPGDGDKF